MKIKQKEKAFITGAEFKKLVTTLAQPIIRTVVQAMFYIDGRISETINFKLDEMGLESKTLHIINGKGSKNLDIPINDKLHKILIH